MSEEPNLEEILRDYLRSWLEADEEARLNAPPGGSVYAVTSLRGREALEQDESIICMLLDDTREALALRDTSSVQRDVDQLAAEYDLPEHTRSRLGIGILQARVQAYEIALERVLKPHAMIELDSVRQSISGALRPPEVTAATGPLFSTFSDLFVDMMLQTKEWTEHTAGQNRNTYSMFIEVCGDQALDAYERKDFAHFYDVLVGLPRLYGKAVKWRGKKLVDIVEENKSAEDQTLSMTTIKRHFAALTSLINKAKERGEIDVPNHAMGFKFPDQSEERKPWEIEDLKKLFSSPAWTGSLSARYRSRPGEVITYDSKYWLPILGLYHGNRLEEFAQLRREDVKKHHGIWAFFVNGEDTRKLKNRQSTRVIPVHPRLIDLGFLKYVDDVCCGNADYVFPDLAQEDPAKKLGTAITKWFTRYRKDIGVYQPLLDYHSFRHTFTTAAYSIGTPEPLIDALTGHESQGGRRGMSSSRGYLHTQKLEFEELYDIVRKIEWPGLLDHLVPYERK